MFTEGDKKRFLSKITKCAESGCWEWQGSVTWAGYGKFWTKGKQTISAHRFSYLCFVGDIPLGLFVLHKCDNRRCVNPEHLFLGDREDNTEDMLSKNRNAFGSRHGLSKLSEKDIPTIRADYDSGWFTLLDLANRYGVTRRTITKIVKREAWRHIP